MYAIGKLAKLSNTTVRTLRYYDQIGILKPSKTGDGGHRYYDENAVEKLHQIMTLKDMGFELDTIHDILTNFQKKTSKEFLQMRLEMIQRRS
ncbi:MerR family transcriptional regulator [Lentibacillus sediminis]|uniref:MerR family transcriptional regulator n=1 Tax=Lentibacillus sediminis TaxID=1940529 RepID=UPI000C1C0BF0|nr:MerR family transcriptional regulator [Lentibacillus sediminis]